MIDLAVIDLAVVGRWVFVAVLGCIVTVGFLKSLE